MTAMTAEESRNTAEAPTSPVEITVLKEDLSLGCGLRRPWVFLYTCTGPDGRRFDNRNIKTLRDVLRHHYGKVTIVIDDQTAASRGQDPSRAY